ncbi:Integrase core domain containing protein [Gossypium australe]|uniref:Integrase core domain containing protein n=1 Tax=Gossypium australe TaxID=47621 RepID=A0A5B6UTE4_9ROSI|nr:Integrase core domain containing protein [Gossypium australe]
MYQDFNRLSNMCRMEIYKDLNATCETLSGTKAFGYEMSKFWVIFGHTRPRIWAITRLCVPHSTTRSSKPSHWMQDYVCYSQSLSSSSLVIGQFSLSSSLAYRHLPPHTQYFVASISHIPKPQTYAKAIKDHRWVEAMQQEIQKLESNVT